MSLTLGDWGVSGMSGRSLLSSCISSAGAAYLLLGRAPRAAEGGLLRGLGRGESA